MNRTEKVKIYGSIVSISFIQGLQFSVAPVLGQISRHYPAVDISLVQMLITGPALSAMVFSLIAGWLAVRISMKKLLVSGSFLAGAAGIAPFLWDSFPLLFACRMLYGISLGLALALNTAVVARFFQGDERVTAMGFQAASIGGGMVVVSAVGGALGSLGFRLSYLVNVIGFISMIVLAVFLPGTNGEEADRGNNGRRPGDGTESIRLSHPVFMMCLLGMLEFLFLISFTTNIAMQMSGELAGNSSASGSLTGIFSGTQIIVGLVLGRITRLFKKAALPAAMASFAVGSLMLAAFPSDYLMLAVGAVFCGISQGIFVPTAMVEVSGAVLPAATAMAAACYGCAQCIGQFISPMVLNAVTSAVFKSVTTTPVYVVAAVGMFLAAVLAAFVKMGTHACLKHADEIKLGE